MPPGRSLLSLGQHCQRVLLLQSICVWCVLVFGFSSCPAVWANCVSFFFPPLCSHLYCFNCVLAEFGLRLLCGQAFSWSCSAHLPSSVAGNPMALHEHLLSFVILFMLLWSSPQSCQLWWHQASEPFAGEGWCLVQWNGHLSQGVECHSSSYAPFCFKLPLDRGWDFCFLVLRIHVCPSSRRVLWCAI